MPKILPIAKLSPAAARLLIASSTILPNETYADLIERSGISDCLTFLSARRQLVELGFIYQQDGREYTRLLIEESMERATEPYATIPYPGTITRVTKAKQ